MSIAIKKTRIQGINIQYYEAGAGPKVIVLLHGAGVDSAMLSWREVMKLLADDYRVIAPDLPGYGESDAITGDYSLDFYTEIIKELIIEWQCPPVVLVGLSMGGGISLNMALKYPELIELLVPVDAWGVFTKLPYHLLTYWYTRSKINENSYKWTGKYPSLIRWSLAYNLISDKSKITKELVEEIQEKMLKPGAGQPFISFQRSELTSKGLKTDLFSRLREIKIPTLLIHGSKDKAVPLKDTLAASKLIPNCQVHIMEGCKHWPQKERPEEFVKALRDFITQNA